MKVFKGVILMMFLFVLILFVATIMLYAFDVVAKHYIYGDVSILLFVFLMAISLMKIKKPKKNIIVISGSVLTVVLVILFHFVSCKSPFTYKYKKIDGGIEITGYTYNISNGYKEGDFYVSIPSKINGKPVKSIGENAFEDCLYIHDLEIPDGVEIIKRYAFDDTDAKSLILPNSLKVIEEKAFTRIDKNINPFFDIWLPDYVDYDDYEIDYVVMPNNLDYLGDLAFVDYVKTAIIRPGTRTDGWQDWCFGTAVSYRDVIGVEYVEDNMYVLYSDKTATLARVKSKLPRVEIPAYIMIDGEKYTVSTIGINACSFTRVEEFVIPNTVLEIKREAFRVNVNLRNIYIPESVLKTGQYLFRGCNYDNLVVHVGHSEEPTTWDEDWDDVGKEDKLNVIWGCK